jgi:hypothetical protein
MERNDPLPSWRPGSTRDALEAFLAAADEVPVADIQTQLGRRPILAAGNSGGDREMLEWAQGRRLA